MKEKCKCGKLATWYYMPATDKELEQRAFCDDCIYRGCSCNEYPTNMLDEECEIIYPDGIENLDYKWLNIEKTRYAVLDGKGRELPCIEFSYDEDGWDLD